MDSKDSWRGGVWRELVFRKKIWVRTGNVGRAGVRGKIRCFLPLLWPWDSSNYSAALASTDPDYHCHQGGCMTSEKSGESVGFAF